jgi:hypothetical protein
MTQIRKNEKDCLQNDLQQNDYKKNFIDRIIIDRIILGRLRKSINQESDTRAGERGFNH